MNPTKVFAVLAAIVLAIVAIFFLTRPDTAAPPAEPRTPDFSLTDTEAIARFEEVDRLRVEALRSRDQSLLSQAFVADSPGFNRVRRSIMNLRRQGVLFRSTYEPVSVTLVANSSDEIRIRVIEDVHPKFVSEDGEDLTRGVDERHTTVWILKKEKDQWLLFDGTLTRVEKL